MKKEKICGENCGCAIPEQCPNLIAMEAGIPESGETGKPIPILDAKRIAENYNYNQVVIVARKVGENGIEHVTTYGTDKANCDVAAHIGGFLRYEIMKWEKSVSPPPQAESHGITHDQFFDLLGASPDNAIVETVWDTLQAHNFIITRKAKP
jgi:hypothetical protein